MSARRDQPAKSHLARGLRKSAAAVVARHKQRDQPKSRRQVASRDQREPFAPPEDWHEPTGRSGYRVLVQSPGDGYRHVVTPDEVRQRLGLLPESFLRDLEVVQLSRMTRKKQSFPCYGMQWGSTLYLYPLEASLVEHFDRPPAPNIVNEARMYGGVWSQPEPNCWTLTWSEASVRDFYLNNILIHELGHLLDDRNTGYTDRERYAEWFAIEYGYRASRGRRGKAVGAETVSTRTRPVRRRHHSS
ncbi:MAG: hypothetical protein AAGJ46_09325 [Planctomycetota bacterium]